MTETRRLLNGQWTQTPSEKLRHAREVRLGNEKKLSGSAQFIVTIKPGKFSGRPRASFTPTAIPTGSPRPRPSFSGTGSAAFRACAKYAPAGLGAGFGRAISSSALAAFKSCLSQNGVKVTGTTASAVLGELRNSTGKTAAAVRTCRVLLQPAAPTPSPST